MKPFLSDKIVPKEQIFENDEIISEVSKIVSKDQIIENDEIISEDIKIAKSLNLKFLDTRSIAILCLKMLPILFLK